MNIVFITPHFWPWFDRAGRVVGQMAVEMLDRGHRPTILSRRALECWPEAISYQGVPTVRFFVPTEKRADERRYQKQLAQWLDMHRDTIDLVCVSGLGAEAVTAVETLGKSRPIVLRAERAGREGDCFRQIETRAARRAKRVCMKAAAFVGTAVTSHAELLAAGYPRDRVVEIPNGTTLRPRRTAESCLAARHILAEANPATMLLDDRAKVALYVGELTDRRRLGLLVLTWRKIAERHTHARLWIAGDGPELPALRRLIESHGLDWSIETLGVFDEPEVLYDAADLFLQPSIDDDLSSGLLEAVAADLPIIATETSTHRRLLTECDTLVPGLSSDPATIERWSAAIDHTLHTPPHVLRPGVAAHDIHRTTQTHEHLFASLVRGC